MDRKKYEKMGFWEIEKLYKEMKKSLGKCFIDVDDYKVYKWVDDSVYDVFMECVYVRNTTEYERLIFDLYWKKIKYQ